MMLPPIHVELPNLASTDEFAARLAKNIRVPQTVALSGTLGAGKTRWTRSFCHALGVSVEAITSPTYVLLHRYHGYELEIYHFDFYRLENEQQVWDLGLDELQESPVLIIIEWAEKFPGVLPIDRLDMQLSVSVDGGRQAELQPTGPLTNNWLIANGLIAVS